MTTPPNRQAVSRASWLVLITLASLSAQATDLPKRKSGLWESSLRLDGSRRPPPRTRLCLDEATDLLLYRYGMGLTGGLCTQFEIAGGGSQFTIRSTCEIGNHRIRTQTEMTFEGNAAYHLVAQSHHEPPLNGRSNTRTEQDARWVGPCEPGQQPGDMVIDPPGTRLNVRDALRNSPSAPLTPFGKPR